MGKEQMILSKLTNCELEAKLLELEKENKELKQMINWLLKMVNPNKV